MCRLIFQPERTFRRRLGQEHFPKGHGPGTEQKRRERLSFGVQKMPIQHETNVQIIHLVYVV